MSYSDSTDLYVINIDKLCNSFEDINNEYKCDYYLNSIEAFDFLQLTVVKDKIVQSTEGIIKTVINAVLKFIRGVINAIVKFGMFVITFVLKVILVILRTIDRIVTGGKKSHIFARAKGPNDEVQIHNWKEPGKVGTYVERFVQYNRIVDKKMKENLKKSQSDYDKMVKEFNETMSVLASEDNEVARQYM